MNQISTIANSKILITSLDWGLGHLTRTLVLIKKLQDQKNEIVFAGNNFQIDFIRKELPNLSTTFIDGYQIKLSSKKSTYRQIINQSLTILKAIRQEQKWLKNYLKSNPISHIISDNRYGMYHSGTISILLTHQITLQIPIGKRIVNTILKRWIEKFDSCWIPDWQTKVLSGNLSDGELSIPKHFIGPLSRFNLEEVKPFRQYYLFIISGPEPERLHFTDQIIDLITKNNLDATLVTPSNAKTNTSVKIIENPNSLALESLINQSEVIVSKSGYTTIMDLIPSPKKIFLIPTKGQYEQLYLHQVHQTRNTPDNILEQFAKQIL